METDVSNSGKRLTKDERGLLLRLARQALEAAVEGRPLPALEIGGLPKNLQEPGATFVTLTIEGQLRGCIGALEATLPLADDVRIHAVASALEDFRFPPVHSNELGLIRIEISRLTQPQLLEYRTPEELPSLLRCGIDGVVLKDGVHRATFLPQVWEKVPEAEVFLSMLCRKMGVPGETWRKRKLTVFTYQVEEFHE